MVNSKNLQQRMLTLAGLFLVLHALLLTLSPAVRYRSWDVTYIWTHWGFIIEWGILVVYAQKELKRRLPGSDPFIVPIVALLCGWGILTIWRIDPVFGTRQAIWFAISFVSLVFGLRIKSLLLLQKYKYILLTGGLILTSFTLLFGTNPNGYGPRLWLGCCNVYFQPSEPLKLLLIIFLSAYFAEKIPYRLKFTHVIYPTLMLGGIVFMLLLAQRDLGTALIFVAIYTILTYLATVRRTIPAVSAVAIFVVGFIGYYFIDIIRIRIESWIYPWNDPQGGSYQIIQALMSMANGGIEGRGPGLGSPGLVPVAHSDFIFSAITEETGLLGTLGLLALFGILITRGIRIALFSRDVFGRFLASGISAYFGIQSVLIMGGNLRLLPLTGVTLPFVSYGGSSLLTSFIAVLILLHVSNVSEEKEPVSLDNPKPYLTLNGILLIGLFASALATGWWTVIRADDLNYRPDNLRRIIAERFVIRGALLDRVNQPITITIGKPGDLTREYIYPDLAPITGYNDSHYGQAGLEESLDGYLRGLNGTSASSLWLNHLLYGMTPPGLDVRLSLDLSLQTFADEQLIGRQGAIVIMNAASGEILAMASHPTFNPNNLSEEAADLLTDPLTPLINRATLGYYPAGTVLDPFARMLFGKSKLSDDEWLTVHDTFRFSSPPQFSMDIAPYLPTESPSEIYISPLQLALSASIFSNQGIMSYPRIATAVNTPNDGWIVLQAEGMSMEVYQASAVNEAVKSLQQNAAPFWSHIGRGDNEEKSVGWFIGGTPPDWQATPLVVVVLLEDGSGSSMEKIGVALLEKATNQQ